jgi:IS5 family transposase
VDALGNPTSFHLTPGQAHDLEGADALLPGLEADARLADKAYDADERVIEPLRHAAIEPVIPTKANRKEPRPYDKDLYKARSLIENFFAGSSNFAPSPRDTTKPLEIFSLRSISPQLSSGSIDDRP